MGRAKSLEAMMADYERLKGGLLKLGPVAQGSILARTLARQDPRQIFITSPRLNRCQV